MSSEYVIKSRRFLRPNCMATRNARDVAALPLYQRRGRLHCGIVDLTTDTSGESTESVKREENESGIECLCCCGELPFEKMSQCSEGHLVCLDCLNTYTTHQIYGQAKFELPCMSDQCQATYPRSEMIRCLSPSTVTKWDERIQEENLKMSDLELSRCPHCNYACVMSPTLKKFFCRRIECQMVSCRNCGVDWRDHEGKNCSDFENKDETSIRKEYEEKMTKATLRTCPKCGTPFYKEDGCNKMTCHCGTTMCYICRKRGINYRHFCSHPHSPGKGCKMCKRCYLWTSSKEDDDRAIKELENEANRKRKALEFRNEHNIGSTSTGIVNK